jgi:hypothetical protein
MTAPAQRMRTMRAKRRRQNLREVRLAIPDTRLASVRRRIATEAARLSRRAENDALNWIESVSEFDERDGASGQ